MNLIVTLRLPDGWVVYDPDARKVVAGPFMTKPEAESALQEIERCRS
jgi:hypothetical protein